ncbi:MAG: glycosyltransferase family 4 protein [Oscillatoriaceae cyanobacterium]
MSKLAVIFANYGPYHLSRINSCHRLFKAVKNWDVVGIELARVQLEYAWIAQIENSPVAIRTVIKDRPLEGVAFWDLMQKIHTLLSQENPDVLAIAGYAHPAMLAAVVWGMWHGKPCILLSATKEDDAPRSWWSETIKSWVLKYYKAALVGGQPQKRYLVKLGMASDRVCLGYNVVDNDCFHPNRISSLPPPNQKPYFLAINRFVAKKNLPHLISCYAAYRQAAGANAWDLVLCGDGQLFAEIQRQVIRLDLQNYVHLPGFLQQDELLPYLAHAKCFIHASIQEQWGLVVNEAMAAGLPVLVSNSCGCFEDLVVEGVNGFGFAPDNGDQLVNLMLKISSGDVNIQNMSSAALAHIQKFSTEYFALGLIQATEAAIKN